MKTLKTFLEIFDTTNAVKDAKNFLPKEYEVKKHDDRNGNGDDVFKASDRATITRSAPYNDENHGYDAGEDSAEWKKWNKSKGIKATKTAQVPLKMTEAREMTPALKAAQENMRKLKDGTIAKEKEAGLHKKVKEKTWAQSKKEWAADAKAQADHHLEQHNHHLARMKEHDDMAHDVTSGNMGITDEDHKRGALEEIEGWRDKHVAKAHHHAVAHARYKDDYEDLSGKKYTKKLDEEVEQIDEVMALKKVGTYTTNDGHKVTLHQNTDSPEHFVAVNHKGQATQGFTGSKESVHKTLTKDHKLVGALHEEAGPEEIFEISKETRNSWITKTFKNHARHRDNETGEIRGPLKPDKKFPEASQKLFFKKESERNDEWTKQHADERKAKLAARTPKVHDLRHMSHGEVYDHTQTSEKIKDGDVLHVKGGVGVMVGAWPTMVHGKSDALHSFKGGGKEIHTTDDGAYKKSGELADKLHKGIKEDVQIDELSKKTLGSYIKKASGLEANSNTGKWNGKGITTLDTAKYMNDPENHMFGKKYDADTMAKAERIGKKRNDGIKTAVDKLTKEDVDQIDELSNTTLRGYLQKRTTSAHHISKAPEGKQPLIKKTIHKAQASTSLLKVSDKMVKAMKLEEVELEEANKENKLKKDEFTIRQGIKAAKSGTVRAIPSVIADKAGHDHHLAMSDGDDASDTHAGRKSSIRTYKKLGRSLTKEDVIQNTFDKYIAEKVEEVITPEQQLAENLKDVPASMQSVIFGLYENLSEDNRALIVEVTTTEEGINEVIDFALSKGE